MPACLASGFDWDLGNREKCQTHGVSIEEIKAVLRGDPQIAPAPKRSATEERFIAVGRTPAGRALFVAFTLRVQNGLVLFAPSALVICMPGRSSDMKRRVPRLTTDEEAEAFLESDLSDLDFSQFKSGRLRFEEGSGAARAAQRAESPPSETYRLFEQAMAEQKQIICMYEGYRRELCPVILGHSNGEEKTLTFQFGGESKSGLQPEGQWKCLWLSGVSDVHLRDGPWRAGSRHSQKQSCAEIVDLDVNAESPYKPKRRLPTAFAAKPDRRGGGQSVARRLRKT